MAFAYLGVVALVTLGGRRRTRALAFGVTSLAVVLFPLAFVTERWQSTVRDWLPGVYLLLGYWLSGHYFRAPMPAVEQRFLAIDRRLYAAGLEQLTARAPRVVLELLELSYLLCFIFVPGGMVLLVAGGAQASADRFWTLVLAGEFGSFGMLPWIQTRPPRDLEPAGAIDCRPLTIRAINQRMVRRTSIGWNTFPSGHVAGSLAVAIAVSEALPALTAPLVIMAILISVSTVIGRYHYAVDAVAGVALTLLAWAVMHGPLG